MMKHTVLATIRQSVSVVLVALPLSVAAAPAALVEDVSSAKAGVQPLDYLDEGRVVELGSGDSLALGYLASCVQERIQGGKVTIGAQQSDVKGGTVQRTSSQCGGARLALAADQSKHSGATAVRNVPLSTEPQLTVFHVSPVIVLARPAATVLKRIDVTGERYRIEAGTGRAVDLAARGVALTPSGIYMATAEGRSVIFEVAPTAMGGTAPLVGRVIPL